MWDKLKELENELEKINKKLSSSEVSQNPKLLVEYSKKHKELSEIVDVYNQYKRRKEEAEEARNLMEEAEDQELKQLAHEEYANLQKDLENIEKRLKVLLLPKDPNDSKNVVLEIRAGTGGDEAALFVGDLFDMYSRYCSSKGWQISVLSSSEGTHGGYKEIIANIIGEGAYSRLKYEKGVHRVQRIPITETQGRVHTSTVTVAILPEAEEVDVEIEDKDLKVEVFRAGGPGGQSVNTTDSAVRITHIPSGIVVSIQDEKSQFKNKAKAMKILRARLLEQKERELREKRASERREQVGTGERSERIRTYNFPQSRVTDHRIGLTLHNLNDVLMGELDCIIEPLITHYQTQALKSSQSQRDASEK